MRLTAVIFTFMLLFTGTGCVSGILYTNITLPLTTDIHGTPVGQKICAVNSKQVQEPFTGIDISLEWDSRAIGDATRQAGFKTVYYADMHILSILGGLWEQQTVCVCGE